ncbi:MAG: DUF5674 family protein [Candidatus Paceibacterota bacterium]|jgi:hypothetical protein
MKIEIITDAISKDVLREIAQEFYGDMIKATVDVEKQILAVGGEWHMDSNNVLIDNGSNQPDIWGINIYIDRENDDRLEYVSLINIRPLQGNRTMELRNEELRNKIKAIVNRFIV